MSYEAAIAVNTVLACLAAALMVAVFILKKRRPGHRLVRILSTIATVLLAVAVVNGVLSGIEMDA